MLMQQTSLAEGEVDRLRDQDQCVLLVGNFLSHHGLGRGVCEELALVLRESGWSVLTTSSRRGRIVRLMDMVFTIWRKRRDYTVAQVDVFSGPAFCLAEAACWTLRAAQRPYALTLHGGDLPSFARRWPRRVRRLLSSAAVVTTPSNYLLSKMSPYCPKLRLLPNALDLSAYEFRLRAAPRPALVWLRAFNKIYNPTMAPQVVSQLAEDFPHADLTMVGPNKKDGSFEATSQLARELGVSGKVTLPGAVAKKEVPQWLHRGDIFLNTTNVDNTPVSVLEAMACGLCVVSTNVGGLPYLLEHERNALLVPPGDVTAMVAAVRRVLAEPGLGEHLSREGRKTAEQFDWSSIVPQWQRLLTSIRL